jgi:ABC-2 type transport system ATP-binding protein
VLLDEPANGLDPVGMAWLRGLLRDLADQGRAILATAPRGAGVVPVADRAARRQQLHAAR